MSPTSEVFRTSLRLPSGVAPDSDFRRSDLTGWFLLDSLAYMVNVCNETAAGSTTLDGLQIQVSFLIAESPRLSYCCIWCTNREENPFACVPTILSSVEDLVLIQVDFTSGVRQWFVYMARGDRGNPSLHLLPDFRPYSRKQHIGKPYGLMSYDEGRQFFLAALSYMDGQYSLHIFGSGASDWTVRELQVDYGLNGDAKFIDPTYVIYLGNGQLGWVDLWEGILICNVRKLVRGRRSRPHIIPMPKPLPSNQELYLQHDFPRMIRDVTFSHGQLKCVELEQLVILRPKAAPVVHDPSDKVLIYDSESRMVPRQEEEDEYEVVGWRLVNWYREPAWDYWHRGTMVHSDDLGHFSLPQLGGGGTCAVNFSFKDLRTCYPTLRGDDVVYLMSILECDQTAWIFAVDTKIKSLSKPTRFPADRSSLLYPTHIPCVLTKYLDTKSDRPPRDCEGSSKKRQQILGIKLLL